jgi:predicted Zn-dependent peptidase
MLENPGFLIYAPPMSVKIFEPYDFSKKVIDGVPVYYKNFPTARSIHIQICFGVGNMDDPKEATGLSHFLEHMIFDGSPKLPNKKTITEWSKINALNSWNAWTFFTNTTYHLKCLPEKLDIVLDGMKDMIFSPLLKESDVEHERKVITQESWGRYKNEKYLAYTRETLSNIFHGTAKENSSSPLGWPETIGEIKREQIVKWHKENYGKGNFFIILGGAISNKDLNKIKTFLSGIPEVKARKTPFGTLKKPKKLLIKKTGEEIGDPSEQTEINFERVMPKNQSDSEEILFMTTALLYDILFERLRTERALCYSVQIGPYVQKDFTGWNANLKVKSDSIAVVQKEFWKAIADILSGKEKNRFKTLKQSRIERLKSKEEVTQDIVQESLSDLWRFGKILTDTERLRQREKITYANVTKCLKKAFDKNWTVNEVILSSKK